MIREIIKELTGESDCQLQKTVDKLRTFKPTITEGFFGKTTTWEERDKPLTNEQLVLMYGVELKFLKDDSTN
jgi:hypothetical protein